VKYRGRCLAAGLASAGVLATGLAAPSALYARAQPPVPARAPAPHDATIPAPAPAPAPAPPPATPAPDPPAAQSVPAPAPAPVVVKQGPQPDPKRHKHRHKRTKHKHSRAHARKAASDTNTDAGVVPPGALPSARRVSVPRVLLDRFGIPPFLLPIYQAAGLQYNVRWEVLAAINEIETDYGRNLNVSSAGAMGWMQFIPSSWATYGVDANQDGKKDPYNPVDAIFAAARYLSAAGADKDLRKAILAYNHADWYADSVLQRARLLAALPSDLIGALTGLAQGRHPVIGWTRVARHSTRGANVRTLSILTRPSAPVVAVADGEVIRIGHSHRLGRFVRLRDVYGNTYTYGDLAAVAHRYAVLTPGAKQRMRSRRLREGSRVIAGTILARTIGTKEGATRGHVRFEVRPTGRHAPRIDPRPILAGWRLLSRAGPIGGHKASIGQLLLLDTRSLARYVLDDKRIRIYHCGRDDIRAGRIDRRVLVTLELLATSRLKPTVSTLLCGHSRLTTSGKVSEHISGNAVDISAINGVPILGHQGPGSVTDAAIQRLLTLQGPLKPHQIISLMTFAGVDNTLALPDHADHIHVGFRPRGAADSLTARSFDGVLDRSQWTRLMNRLSRVANPLAP
jgi:soluble lytic murein transglycosylase-like protein